MPRFYFHVFDSANIVDPNGMDLASWQDAQAHAIRCMGEILQSNANSIKSHEDWHMDVTDQNGLLLLRLDFSIIRSVALNYTIGFGINDALSFSDINQRYGKNTDER